MRFYKVHCRCEGGTSQSIEWFTSRRQAERCRSARIKDAKATAASDDPSIGEFMPDEVEPIDIIPTKRGILRALRHWASHADNG
jgi:hypothetical protein